MAAAASTVAAASAAPSTAIMAGATMAAIVAAAVSAKGAIALAAASETWSVVDAVTGVTALFCCTFAPAARLRWGFARGAAACVFLAAEGFSAVLDLAPPLLAA